MSIRNLRWKYIWKSIKGVIIYMNRLLVGIKEAAGTLGISHWTLREYVRAGKVPHVRIGRRVLVEPAELERMVAEGRRGVSR